ncbi:HET-domain-containing protein [Lojkania enalia]|uniref:HET-domain-containing protein n=1 Tax=Lojkania enalia TaxID=147567 RepID=A0A9P4N7A9_9PLEO|nr:HET-domain-containing protein [Didymosphaeria enalia]
MRLLQLKKDGGFSLVERIGRNVPPYAILSHTWGANDDDEVNFKDLVQGTGTSKPGYDKLRFCYKQATKDSIDYVWIDTCCIDRSSSVELSEAINSMFRWYHESVKCYVYLSDVSTSSVTSNNLPFWKSRWFTRGWTLQELLAPKSALFYSVEGNLIDDRDSLAKEIAEITGIASSAIQGRPLLHFSVEERMSWVARRETKREEDMAYSLLGIFDIHMPLIYGEGKEKAFKRLQKEIQECSTDQAKQKPRPSLNLPYNRDPDFVDRPDILTWINGRCLAKSSRTALVGLGGIGKSQVAIQYCYNIRAASPHTWVFWVHAGTQARFEDGYRRIAEATKIDGYDNPKVDVLRLVRSWLCHESNGRWVMVVDNADDPDVLFPPLHRAQEKDPLSDFLPQSPNGSILITSRSRDVAFRLTGSQSSILEVRPMKEADALVLLERKLGCKPEEDNAVELLRVLDCMPLAITQAAAYIAQRAPRMTVSRYLDEVRRSDHDRARLLKKDVGDSRRDGRASNSIMATWQISFEYIRRKIPTAAQLLSLMSLFDRQGIPERLLYDRYVKEGDGEADFEEDIHTLTSYSLVGMNANGKEFEMHQLVQFSTKKWLELNQELEQWKGTYAILMDANYPIGRHENWIVCQALFPHAQAAERWRWKEAEELEVQVMETSLRVLRDEHPDTLTSMANLASTYRNQGRWKEAEELEVQVMETSLRVLGDEHPHTLASMANLASTYRNQGRWKEAEELEVQVMETSLRVLGDKHPDTLTSMANLASTLWNQGRWKEAEELEVQVMEMRKRGGGRRRKSWRCK